MGCGNRGGGGHLGGRRPCVVHRRTRRATSRLIHALEQRPTPQSQAGDRGVMLRDPRLGRGGPHVELGEAAFQHPGQTGAQNGRHVHFRAAGFARRRPREPKRNSDGGSDGQRQARCECSAPAAARRVAGRRMRRSFDLIDCRDLQRVVNRGRALAPEVGRARWRWRVRHVGRRQRASERHELLARAEPVAREAYDVSGRLTPVISLDIPPFPQPRCRPFPAVFR